MSTQDPPEGGPEIHTLKEAQCVSMSEPISHVVIADSFKQFSRKFFPGLPVAAPASKETQQLIKGRETG